MRCKTCDYPLWNLTTRVCPECGTAFLPSDFEFVINSVRFCCPKCEQAYYGTGPRGHLVPQEFNCVTCGQRVQMDQMVLRPAEGVQEQQTQTERTPWLERRQRGIVKAWFGTVGKAMVNPTRLMQALAPQASSADAWLFALVTALVVALVAGIPRVGLMFVMLAASGPPGRTAMSSTFGWLVMPVVLMVVMPLVLIVILGPLVHGLLRLTGSTEHGLQRTYQAMCYSSGANSPSGVPCVGPYFGWIWWVVSAVLMVSAAQRVSGARSSFAVITSAVLGFVLWIGGIFLGMVIIFSPMRSAILASSTASFGTPVADARLIGQSLKAYALANNGRGPAHAAELVVFNGLGASNFISQTATDESLVPLANTTLAQFQMLPPNRKNMAAQAAANALPQNVVAHRLGDVVFTYHGINLGSCDPGLWLAIVSPDPDQNPSASGNAGSIAVARSDGVAYPITGSFPQALAAQNQLRAKYGLPPLPDPATVTHASPATAGP